MNKNIINNKKIIPNYKNKLTQIKITDCLMDYYIEKVIYINLKERVDRKKTCEKILNNLFKKDKIIRFDAIRHKYGHVGCAMSHIKSLELAIKNNWKNILIVEDDILWTKESSKLFLRLINKPYDVIVLGGTMAKYDKFYYNLYSCQTTTGYIVNKHYMKILYIFWKKRLQKLIKFKNWNRDAIDQSWTELQMKDNWKLTMPSIFIQRQSWSDIEKKLVNYVDNFNSFEDIQRKKATGSLKKPKKATGSLKKPKKATLKKLGSVLIFFTFLYFCGFYILNFIYFFFIYFNFLVKYNKKYTLNITTSRRNSTIEKFQKNYKYLFKRPIHVNLSNKHKILRTKLSQFFYLFCYIIRYRPKKIVSHSQKVTKLLKIINYIIKIPYLIHVIHENDYNYNISNADKIFYLNNYQKKKLEKINLIKKSNYFPNFLVNYKDYRYDDAKLLKIKNIGLIDRFSDEKNFETVIKSMGFLKNFQLIIARLENLDYEYIIKKYNLNNVKIVELGDKNIFYNNVDIIIIPSNFESFFNSALEAISNKKLVICSKNYDYLPIFKEEENKIFISDYNNTNEYVEKIKYFSNNIGLVNKIINKNYDHFLKNFSLISAYNKLNQITFS